MAWSAVRRNSPRLWGNVARLAVDELIAHERLRDAGGVLAACCRPTSTGTRRLRPRCWRWRLPPSTTFAGDPDELEVRGRDFAVLHQVALAAVADYAAFTPRQRLLAGNLLAARPGLDTRPGVTVRRPARHRLGGDSRIRQPGRPQFTFNDGQRDTPHPGLPTFWMAKYPITYAQFRAFVDAPTVTAIQNGVRIGQYFWR